MSVLQVVPLTILLVRWSVLQKVKVAQSCPTLCDPMDYTVMEFFRLEYWGGEPIPSPVDLPDPGIQSDSPALQVDSLPAEPQGSSRMLERVAYPFSSGSS